MIRYVREVKATRYLLLTECSMGDNIAAEARGKEMLRLCSHRCPHMQEITLEDTLESLRNTRYVVELDEEVRQRALASVQRMLAV
jgi:quinolinate synthase